MGTIINSIEETIEPLFRAGIQTVGIVDPRSIMREALCALFQRTDPSISFQGAPAAAELLAPTGGGVELVLLHVGSHPIACAWVEAETTTLKKARVPVILLCDSASLSAVIEGMYLGARGYILTRTPPRVAACAMRLVHAGEVFVPVEALVEEGLLAEATMQPQSPDEPEAKSKATLQQHLASLTARERMVLTLLCQGKSNKQIGRELAIVETTAKVHVCRIMKKLRVHNRTQVFAAVGHLL